MTTVVAPAARGADLLDRARELAPALAARSLEIERAGALPPDLVRQLRETGLLRMARPARLGGGGIEPRRTVEVIEELSRADGATGWCVLVANIGSASLAWLEPDAADQILAAGPDPLIASDLAPLGRAARAGDRYRLDGRWPFGSGCWPAGWFVGGFLVMSGGRPQTNQRGVPELRLAHFPASQARVEDTRRMAGLAGAGSYDVIAEGVRVPAAFTSVPYPGVPDHPDPLCRLSAYNLLMTLLAGFPLGVARRALTEARGQLAQRGPRSGGSGRLSDPAVQLGLLRHETALAAARRQVLDTLDELLDGLVGGEDGYPYRARLAAAVIHAYDVARAAAIDCFRLAGTGALFADNPLQRCMRDLVAGSQHGALSADSRTRVANALLGLQTHPVFFGV